MQLKHHLAFAALCDRRGDTATLATLFKVLHLAFNLRDIAGDADSAFYASAEAALDAYTELAAQGDWHLLDNERALLEQLLLIHDAQ
ncbi:hypothetical protein [Burkholderia pyrrocinia]|uniref:hypothetical protein n=1 Tax=Burkholderia pyrrocinia TaxID=60550 RepID=UPI002AB16A81|nr:hypothetical protein [Burkholderia pyrrocinia]